MIPLGVLIATMLMLKGLGALGVSGLSAWEVCLRGGLAAMFLLTASAHWGRRRPDLIRMVPAAFPRPDLIVSVTGVLELLGAAGLLVQATTQWAAACLAILLVAMFPANVRAARQRLSIGGRPAMALIPRTLVQVVFVAALGAVAVGGIV
ncbi:MAG: DoxX family protein [Paludibaculum sp.]